MNEVFIVLFAEADSVCSGWTEGHSAAGLHQQWSPQLLQLQTGEEPLIEPRAPGHYKAHQSTELKLY